MPRQRQTPLVTADPVWSARNFTVHFNSKRAAIAGDLVGHLTAFIEATSSTLDCAIYDLRAPEILQALKTVHGRGQTLRIAYDAGPIPSGGLVPDPSPSSP